MMSQLRLHRRKRGRRPRGLRAQRGHRGLPDHAGLPDGRARRRLGRSRASEPVGAHARRRRDAVGGGGRGGAARGATERGTGDDVHRQPGPAVDGSQHVQDRRRADAVRDPRGRAHRRHPRTVHLRRPLGRHARPHHRVGDARRQLGAGGPRLRAREPRGDAASPSPVPALLRRVPHQPRDRQDRAARRQRSRRPRPRRRRRRPPAAGLDARRADAAWYGAEPGRVLPGPGGRQSVLRRRAGCRHRGVRRARHADRSPLRARRLRRRDRCGSGDRAHGLGRRRSHRDRRGDDRGGREGRSPDRPPLPSVPGGGLPGRPATDDPRDRRARPHQGTRCRRRAALPRCARCARRSRRIGRPAEHRAPCRA